MQGINKPTAIQALAWPALYSGRDLMCIGLPTSSRVISVNIRILTYFNKNFINYFSTSIFVQHWST